MLSIKDATPISDFKQLDDREYHIHLMSYHLNNIHASIKEIHHDLERFFSHFSELKELQNENK